MARLRTVGALVGAFAMFWVQEVFDFTDWITGRDRAAESARLRAEQRARLRGDGTDI